MYNTYMLYICFCIYIHVFLEGVSAVGLPQKYTYTIYICMYYIYIYIYMCVCV